MCEEFLADVRKDANEYASQCGIEEAQQIFAENPAELTDLMRQRERYLSSSFKFEFNSSSVKFEFNMDKAKVVAFVAESRRLLGAEPAQKYLSLHKNHRELSLSFARPTLSHFLRAICHNVVRKRSGRNAR